LVTFQTHDTGDKDYTLEGYLFMNQREIEKLKALQHEHTPHADANKRTQHTTQPEAIGTVVCVRNA
jgi:hypothetical protein